MFQKKRILASCGEQILSLNFQSKHKKVASAFTRNRKLTFAKLCCLILRKSRKSLQCSLNEFFLKQGDSSVTSSAYTQARANLLHTAFIDLNEQSIVDKYYSSDDYKTFLGHRLIAIDGSCLYLPDTPDISKSFGRKETIQKGKVIFSYVGAQSSACYDVLNKIVINAELDGIATTEMALFYKHLKHLKKSDLVILDRYYPGLELFSKIKRKNADFLVRSTTKSYKVVEEFLKDKSIDKIVKIHPNYPKMSKRVIKEKELPAEFEIRLIKVLLENGETEVLITSLLDEIKYPHSIFKDLYFKRWGVETYFSEIKGLLTLEAFTGKTAESVKQDYFSTILVSNLEKVCTEEIDSELESKNTKMVSKQVNKAVSYNQIKNNILEILFSHSGDSEKLDELLTETFRRSYSITRKTRKVDRQVLGPGKIINWHKRKKKFVF